jgi:LemA protein
MGVVLITVAGLGVAMAVIYNSLARLRLLATNAWADIDVQLKRRHDLIPRLVATVEGHSGYEKRTLQAVVEARSRAMAAGNPRVAGPAESELGGAVRGIFAVAEAYPDLTAQKSYLELQRTLTDIEDQIQNARRYYNAVIRDLNTRIAQFPANLVARSTGFSPGEFFGVGDDDERAVPQIELGGPGS